MQTLLLWSAAALAEAVLMHFGTIRLVPWLVSWRSVKRLREYAGRINVICYRGLPLAGRSPLTANPDAAVAFGVYDLTEGPVRIQCAIPSGVACWSLALYTWEGENYHVILDGAAGSPRFELVILPPGRDYVQAAGEQFAVSPARKGMVAVRAILRDRNDQEEVVRVERAMCETMIAR